MESKYDIFKKYQKPLIFLTAFGYIGGIGSLIIGIDEKDMQLVLASVAVLLAFLLLSYYIYKGNQD